jgi:hypothetical protein
MTGTLQRARVELDERQFDDVAARLNRLRDVLNKRQLSDLLPLIDGQLSTLCARLASLQAQTGEAKNRLAAAQIRFASQELQSGSPFMREWADTMAAAKQLRGFGEVSSPAASAAGPAAVFTCR